MKKLFYTIRHGALFVLAALSFTAGAAHVQAQNPNASATAATPGVITSQEAVVVLREARPCLETTLNCNLPLGYLVSRYHQGQAQIEELGAWDGKNWYRVTYGGGQSIVALEDIL